MERIIELPKDIDADTILYLVECEVDKNVFINVPMNYRVIVLVNEKIAFRIDACAKENIMKAFDKSLNGKMVKFVYMPIGNLPAMSWGFGNIQVNNERLKEAYKVGVNGKYIVEIKDYIKLLKCFNNANQVTIEDLREKTVSYIRVNGIPILSAYFAGTNISVFEIDSKLQEIRDKMKSSLMNEKVLGELGVVLSELTVEGIHVNEEDLEIIRNRLNG